MLAGRVRQGTTPAIGALAVIIIAVSLVGAMLFELARRYEDKREKTRSLAAAEAERAEMAA